eukprot:snap_masked-scaffold375_size191602-processed-gene-0.3 protein:Tk05032 transcript:snap_masked-scaffold375_size191602-processed-gene-0.3-mRNA-1 annotation:"hypothetical protein DAPPUDRAFT_301164"
MTTAPDDQFIRTIEWEMLDKQKFFPLSMASSFTVRCFLYPLSLVRTRLQVQYRNDVYRGTWDAFSKIARDEGVRGLYRGFWVSAFQVVSGVCYVSTYEGVRHLLDQSNVTNSALKGFVGGGCASVVGQTIIVPFDVISQHLMLLGQKGGHANNNPFTVAVEGRTKTQIVWDITRSVHRTDGLRGFYRGYVMSLGTYVPSSASWWAFYQIFQDFYEHLTPAFVPHMMIQCVSAMSSGCASCLITNPLDLIRARVQVQRRTIPDTVRYLWNFEGMGIFTKGLTARMTSSVIYSLAIIFGYETVKRCSVHEEYKKQIKW